MQPFWQLGEQCLSGKSWQRRRKRREGVWEGRGQIKASVVRERVGLGVGQDMGQSPEWLVPGGGEFPLLRTPLGEVRRACAPPELCAGREQADTMGWGQALPGGGVLGQGCARGRQWQCREGGAPG